MDLLEGEAWDHIPNVCTVSCKTEKGLETFVSRLQSELSEICANAQQESPLITSSRQRHHLKNAYGNLKNCIEILGRNGDLALASDALRKVARQIGSITASGRINTEEMLDVLFQSFCIGK